ncbi:uncharacterized protein LOC128712516 [Anopheles marshallii]|uniref:uncharacterized protein LOC128712516 n=1 Tax=Anopheles marshallii TaxID=1521116 RepID=UPI00237A0CB1|nr:uncharacterized protein LOC128712516 [Anopheles marshallii]
MFRNRISVVRKAKAASKSSTIQSSLGSIDEAADKGDGPSSSHLGCVSLQSGVSRASETPSVGNESGAMEYAKPDEGICLDENAFFMDDSGEIRENELLLAEDDDNDVTKDLDFSRTSPALFSLTSPKRARMTLEIQQSVERNGPTMNLVTPESNYTLRVTPSSSSFVKPSVPETSPSAFRCIVNETPQQPEQHRSTAWSIRSSSQSKQSGVLKRQTITGAIDDLNEMTEELIDFIRNFEEKYPTAINGTSSS